MDKIAHFIWLNFNRDGEEHIMRLNEYASIRTFRRHHPEWSIMLHTNCVMSGVFSEKLKSLNVNIIGHSLREIPDFINRKMPVHKADFIKIDSLRKHGGLVVDISDTIVVSSFDKEYHKSSVLTNGEYKIDCSSWYPSSIMMINNKGNKVFDLIMSCLGIDATETRDYFENSLSQAKKMMPSMFRGLGYELTQPIHYHKEFESAIKNGNISNYIYKSTLSIHWFCTSDNGLSNVEIDIRNNCIREVTLENYLNLKNLYADAIRFSLGNEPL